MADLLKEINKAYKNAQRTGGVTVSPFAQPGPKRKAKKRSRL